MTTPASLLNPEAFLSPLAIDQAVQRALQKTQLSDLLRSEPEMAVWIRSQPEAFPLRTLS